jgi:organic hydroperoxide reductase OsmC/OhrA
VTGIGGRFTEVALHPTVTVENAAMASQCDQLLSEAHARCSSADSVSPVTHVSQVVVSAEC